MICDVRIDDRLIHGQVCGFWIPHYSLERIAIVDNEIVNDQARKTALKFGCPEKCKLSIFSVDAAVDKFKRKIDEGIRVMILCSNPLPLLEMVEKGYEIREITVGNMSTKPGAVQVKKTVFVSAQEREAFLKLAERGVSIVSQMVPGEPRENLINDLKKG